MKFVTLLIFVAFITFVSSKQVLVKQAPVKTEISYNDMFNKLKQLDNKLTGKLQKLQTIKEQEEINMKRFIDVHEKNLKDLKDLSEKASKEEKEIEKKFTKDSKEYQAAKEKFLNMKKKFEKISVDLVKAKAAIKRKKGAFQEVTKLNAKEKLYLEHEIKLIKKMLKITSVHMSK